MYRSINRRRMLQTSALAGAGFWLGRDANPRLVTSTIPDRCPKRCCSATWRIAPLAVSIGMLKTSRLAGTTEFRNSCGPNFAKAGKRRSRLR